MDDVARSRLRSIGLLHSLPDDELHDLEQRCRWRRYPAGTVVIEPGRGPRDVFFVVEGRVRASGTTATGREVIYGVIAAGSHFGELAALDGEVRSARVTAVDDCVLAILPADQFESVLRRHADVALALLRDLVGMIRTADQRLLVLGTLGARARLCRELRRLAMPDPGGPGGRIDPLPARKDLAAAAGTTRETIARVLSQLAREGMVERHGRILQVRNLAALDEDQGP